jgi:hypothetical protein
VKCFVPDRVKCLSGNLKGRGKLGVLGVDGSKKVKLSLCFN